MAKGKTLKKAEQPEHLKKRLVLEALEKSGGIVAPACKAAKVGRTTFYMWMKDDTDFAAQVADLKEVALDTVESVLFEKATRMKDLTAVIFYLKTQGAGRGYGERTTVKLEKDRLDDLTDEELAAEIERLKNTINGK